MKQAKQTDKKIQARLRRQSLINQNLVLPKKFETLNDEQLINIARMVEANTKQQSVFIKQARELYGDTYDYSKVEYKGGKNKLKFICKKHGEFLQRADTFLAGHACQICGTGNAEGKGRGINSQEQFLKRAREIHGDVYDYSKAIYKGGKNKLDGVDKKIIIICKKHGEFQLSARKHLEGQPCRKCLFEAPIKLKTGKIKSFRKKTTEEFIAEAKAVHGNKFDYSKTIYTGGHDKTVVICKIHGEFKVDAAKHLAGTGCNKCNLEKRTHNDQIFIRRAKKIHKNYDYSKVVYKNSQTKVVIICDKGHEFSMAPNKHINSRRGCPKCSAGSIEKFITKAKKVHGNKFDYSKCLFKGMQTKIIIICKLHGEFMQTPANHIHGGCGCPHPVCRMKTRMKTIRDKRTTS